MMRALLRQILLGSDPVPEYAAIALAEPQNEVGVELRGLGPPIDVTNNNVVVSLKPLRIGVALPGKVASGLRRGDRAELAFCERIRSDAELGVIHLALAETKPLGGEELCIFRSRGSINRCVPRWRSAVDYGYRSWSARRRKSRYNPQMSRGDLQSLFVFYTSPRPVVLVTVQNGERGNLFPMDLIGPTSSPYFLLALHTTSPSVEAIKRIGRVTLSRMPAEAIRAVYALGKNHRVAEIEWNELPLELRSTPAGSRIPVTALGFSEMRVEQCHDMGSHTLFVTRVVEEERMADGLSMCHVQGYYSHDRQRRGARFLDAKGMTPAYAGGWSGGEGVCAATSRMDRSA